MTLFEVINIFKELALSTPNIRSASEGSVYDKLNTNNSIEYDVFHITQTTHTEDFETDYYGLTLFYISRLEDSLEDNRLQIQSIGKEILGNIVRTFCENFNIDFPDITYIPFTQRFTDLCAGIYCNIRIEIPKELICPDNYLAEVMPASNIKLQDIGITITQNGLRVVTPDFPYDGIGEIRIDVQVPQTTAEMQDKEVTYTENGVYTVHPDEDYDGMTSVQVEVDVPDMYEEGYEAGERAGEENQKAKLVSTSFTENNTYTREDGYSAVTVNVPDRYDEGYTEGKEDGIDEQKAKLSALTVTINGEYRREDGYSAITVNVPQTGSTINNQTKSFRFDSGNTVIEKSELIGGGYLIRGKEAYTVTPDSGYTGLDSVEEELFVNVSSVYSSGQTEGIEMGREWQKQLLVSTAFTENGTYTKEDGYSAVTVNVPSTTAYTDLDLIANLQGEYFVIPYGTNALRDFAFYRCRGISSITIPDTVTYIGSYAFGDCTNLTDISIPSSVDWIDNNAFSNCSGLTAMTFEGLTPPSIRTGNSLGSTAYTFPIYVPCESLQAYQTAFGSAYAPRIQCVPTPVADRFWVIYNVTSTTNPTQILSNDINAHNRFSKMIYNNTEYPISTAFTFSSTGRQKVYYELTNGYATIGPMAFYRLQTVREVYFPSFITETSLSEFQYCSGLTNVTLSEGLTNLASGVFLGCVGLTDIVIPNSVTDIGAGTFQGCSGLTSATIGNGVEVMGGLAFNGCSNLTKITILATTPPTLNVATGYNEILTFDNTNNCPIYVPAASVNAYKSAESWAKYASRITAITN